MKNVLKRSHKGGYGIVLNAFKLTLNKTFRNMEAYLPPGHPILFKGQKKTSGHIFYLATSHHLLLVSCCDVFIYGVHIWIV